MRMRYLFFALWSLLVGGALFVMLFTVAPVSDPNPFALEGKTQVSALPFTFTLRDFNLLDAVIAQVREVTSFAAQAIGAVSTFNLGSVNDEIVGTQSGIVVLDSAGGLSFPARESFDTGSLLMNIPLSVDGAFTVTGVSRLIDTTIAGELVVFGNADVSSLIAQGVIRAPQGVFSSLTVNGEAQLSSAQINGPMSIVGMLAASGGIDTLGNDVNLGEGELFASNVVNRLVAGSNITISGTTNAPIISARAVSIPRPDLAEVRARGGCDECLLDSDIDEALTLLGGTINNTPIGLSAAASAAFAHVRVGTSSAPSTLSVYGNIYTSEALAVEGAATSTFASGIDVASGCVAVQGVCIVGGVNQLVDLADVSTSGTLYGDLLQFNGTHWVNVSTSSLGFAETFLDLGDTPSSYIAHALVFSSALADGLVQSEDLVFDGTNLSIGTSSSITTLTVSGSLSLLNREAVRFYDTTNTSYVGFRASSTLSGSTLWTLPANDGDVNHVLVTDGSGNLRFTDITAIGGGSDTFIGLTDTPHSYIAGAIPFASATTSLLFSSNFVFDGQNLGIGTNAPTSHLTIQGSVRFESNASTPGFVYNQFANKVGIGTAAPDARLTVQGGSITQRGGVSGSVYTPVQVGSFNLPDNGNDVQIVGAYAYVVNGSAGNEFRIINISNPAAMSTVGSVNLPASANALAVSGKYAYVVTDVSPSEFQVIDISNPAAPSAVASVNLSTSGFDVFVQGRYAYVVTGGTGDDFHVIDISNPLQPREVGSLELNAGGNGVAVAGSYAYVALNTAGDELQVINISNPTAPTVVETLDLPSAALDVFISGSYAYVVTSGLGNDFHIINISNPLDISSVGSLNLTAGGNSVVVSGKYAYIATSGLTDNVAVIDISNSATPVLVGALDLGSGSALGIDIVGTFAYVVTSSSGDDLHIVNISGVDAQSAFVHALGSGSLSVQGDAKFSEDVFVYGEFLTGVYGIQTDGGIFSQGTGTSFFKGSVGIGTTTSGNLLSLYSSAGDAAIELGVSSGVSNRFVIGIDQSDQFKFKISSSTALGVNDRFVIDGAGRIGIGTSTPSQELVVSGTIQSTDLLGGGVNLVTDAQGNIIREGSDRRLKTDIHTVEDALSKVLQLRGVSYRWRDEARFGSQVEIGFIAQEVDEVLPEVVRKGGEYWALNTRNILAVVIEAFKELWVVVQGNSEKIQELEERVRELEGGAVQPPEVSYEHGDENDDYAEEDNKIDQETSPSTHPIEDVDVSQHEIEDGNVQGDEEDATDTHVVDNELSVSENTPDYEE